MPELTIYHNPRCSKSRACLGILEQSGHAFRLIDYLKQPPTASELRELSQKLGLPPTGFIRSEEAVFQELGLSLDDARSDDDWFALMAQHPILIERPIVVSGARAVVARPPENVSQLL